MNPIRTLIVDDISETRDSIRRLLQFEVDIEVVGEAASGSEALRMAESLRPDIVLMDINMPEMDGIRTTELMSLRIPNAAVIIMSVQSEQAYLRQAMMAGAREFIIKPFSGDELASVIVRVFEIEKRKREALGFSEKSVVIPEQKKERHGQVLSFFSSKGGVGKTTLAVNLAVQLALMGKFKVLLIDLNLQFGDIAIFLNMVPKRSIADLTQNSSLGYSDIQDYLLTHSSGLQVLAAPTRPEYAELISSEHIETIIKEVKPHFDFIICDNVSRFEDTSLASLDLSDQIWMVVSMDVPTLKNAKLGLEVLGSLHYDEKIKVIVNRSSKELGLELGDVEKSLNTKVTYEVPSDGKLLVTALNRGIPFVKMSPQSRVSEAINVMVKGLTTSDTINEQSVQKKEEKGQGYLKSVKEVFSFSTNVPKPFLAD